MIVAGSAVIALMLAKSENTVTTRNMPPIAAMAVPIALHAPSDANSFDAHQSSNAQTAMTSTGDTQPGRLWGGVFGDGTLHLFSPLSKNEGKDDFCSCMGWREKKQQRAAHG